jgi:hypothetical protein
MMRQAPQRCKAGSCEFIVPYAQAFARGAEQDRLLRELTMDKTSIGDIDLAAADAKVRARLKPLAA